MKHRISLTTVTMAALAVSLAACNNNDDDNGTVMPPPPPPAATDDVPASATASPQAYVTFVGGLGKTETGKPLDVSQTKPPTSETALPSPI